VKYFILVLMLPFPGKNNWSTLINLVLKLPPHRDVKVWKWEVPHPLESGFKKSIGDPFGQKADYRLILRDGRSIHVREYDKFYRVHWDKMDPRANPIAHLAKDAPHWLLALALVTLGIIGRLWQIRSKD